MSSSIPDVEQKPTSDKNKIRSRKARKKKNRPKKKVQTSKEINIKAERPFPRVTLEAALRVPTAIKEKNAGNPYSSEDVAKALKLGPRGPQFFT